MLFPQHTPRSYSWTAWKAAEGVKGGQYQHQIETDASGNQTYVIWFYDEPEVHVCKIWKGAVPDGIIGGGYTQAQNDSDKADWETNFLPTSNLPITPRAADGRPAFRMTTASKARNFNLKVFSFILGDSSSLKNLKAVDFTDAGDVTITCYDALGVVTVLPANAVKTVLDWEPTYNYEIIGGWIDLPPTLVGGTTDAYWVSCIGIPDIPAVYGGSVPFVFPVNLERVFTQQVVSDGRATQYLTYDPVHHTNKLRWTFKHPVNAGVRMQICVQTFA